MLVLSRIIAVLRALSRAAPWHALALIPLSVAEGLLPIGFILGSGMLVAAIAGGRPVLPSLVLTAALYVARQVVTLLRSGIARAAGSRLGHWTAQQVMSALLTPAGIAHLEDPDLADDLERQRLSHWHYEMLTRGVHEFSTAGVSMVAGVTASVVLAGFRWWAPVLMAAAWVATHVWLNAETSVWEDIQDEIGPDQRRVGYFHSRALDTSAQKEFRLFALGDWWVERWETLREPVIAALRRARPPLRSITLAASVVVAAHVIVLVLIARAAAGGEIGIAPLTVFVQATIATSALGPGGWTWWLLTLSIPFPHLERLPERIGARDSQFDGRCAAIDRPQESIGFEGVGFVYPSGGEPVFNDLDLTIEVGRSLAIVGSNGAGKTTLVKLLARLYDPTAGRVTIDGRDLRDFDPASWRRQTAVIFQDFTRFPWTLRDNIRAGWLEAPDDAVLASAVRTGADGLAAQLERGWDTVPLRTYAGGAEISGGEWQRLALARALLATDRGAKVLVLDEPTAQLDVRAEAELFDRFLDMTHGLTTILISHRFSSVRHADRIVVIEGGRVIEDGTHEQLLGAGERYAHMFRLQAKPFSEEVTAGD